MNNVAKFLESRGMPEQALEVATDVDYRFELAVQLGRLETALEIAGESDSESKWKQLGELAMSSGKLDVRALLRTSLGFETSFSVAEQRAGVHSLGINHTARSLEFGCDRQSLLVGGDQNVAEHTLCVV